MKISPSLPAGSRRVSHPNALRVIATVLFAGGLAAAALAQPPSSYPPGPYGRAAEVPAPRRDVRVVIENPHAAPRFLVGPRREEFAFVREVPAGRHIISRELFLDYLLRPSVNAFAWGLGDIADAEVATMLGLPLRTTVYAVDPTVAVVSSVPSGYFVAQALPQDVALVTNTPQGPMVLVRRMPPGAVVAYQSSANGMVLNECVVVPPVQQVVVMPEPVPPPPAVYASSQPAQPAPAPAAAPQVPVAPGKNGKIVYDGSGKPIGVIIVDGDGKQEFVPIQ